MTNQNDYITIREGALLTGKGDLTIRRLIKKKKIDYKMINNAYYINRVELKSIYPFIEQGEINQDINQTNLINKKDDMNNQIINHSIEQHIKPLLDNILYYQEENKKYQKLLSDGEAGIIEREKEYVKKIGIYKRDKKLLIRLIIILIVLFSIYILINKGLITVNL